MASEQLPIRQIGDPILHQPSPAVDFNQIEDFTAYYALLKEEQRLSGGVGVACNQYAAIAAPLAWFWIGTDDEATRTGAALRYPGETIPHATLMLNPQILSYSAATYFPPYGEGCLSVAGPIRGKVRRHRSVRLRYQTIDGATIEQECTGFEAHIIQHEYDHLQGIVFLQKIFADCSTEQQTVIARLLHEEMAGRPSFPVGDWVADKVGPLVVFDRDGDVVVFDPARLALALSAVPSMTLQGMLHVLTGCVEGDKTHA